MDTNKFNDTNYNDCLRNLMIVLDFENQGYVLDKPLPTALLQRSLPERAFNFDKWLEDNRKVRIIILVSMTNEIQKQYDRLHDVPSIMLSMKEVYAVPDRHIRYAATKVFLGTKMAVGSSVQSHEVNILFLVEKLEDLKAGLENDTYIDVIIQTLPPSYDPFIVNYNMNELVKSIHELINMLVQYEAMAHKSVPAILVGEAPTSKAKDKRPDAGRGRKAKERLSQPLLAPETPLLPQRERAKEKLGVLSGREQMMCACIAKKRCIRRGSVHNSSPTQVLERSRKLSKDEMILMLGDGKAFAAEAVESVNLVVFVSRNTVFLEKNFPADSRRDKVLLEESSKEPRYDNTTSFEPPVLTDSVQVLRRSTRESRLPERYGFVGLTSQLDTDPKTCGEAMSHIDSDKWLEAMKYEMDSMGSNQVWNLVDLPKGVKPVEFKWVYKHKLGADQEVTTFKARLVEKGYTQRPGVDFEKTYSPVAMAKSIRILLSIAAWCDYEIWQMDVKTAFLNGFVKEEIYMDQPKGFTSIGEEQKGNDFIKNEHGPCVYKKISGSSVAYLVLYVDDILLIGNDVKVLGNIKAWFHSVFHEGYG
ncbi:UNVERIFIED_CONTAM: Copia protein [Sesamum latifolium]|uniref:Copia protein n=1 Tax=Sesamum latifolium TaxID=2727402 RepID=A0AAW2XI63_9LAMI